MTERDCDRSFIGLGTVFASHDKFATEGEGPIQDRTTEHLGYTDKAIAASRRGLLNAITAIEAGSDPPHVVRDPAVDQRAAAPLHRKARSRHLSVGDGVHGEGRRKSVLHHLLPACGA